MSLYASKMIVLFKNKCFTKVENLTAVANNAEQPSSASSKKYDAEAETQAARLVVLAGL